MSEPTPRQVLYALVAGAFLRCSGRTCDRSCGSGTGADVVDGHHGDSRRCHRVLVWVQLEEDLQSSASQHWALLDMDPGDTIGGVNAVEDGRVTALHSVIWQGFSLRTERRRDCLGTPIVEVDHCHDRMVAGAKFADFEPAGRFRSGRCRRGRTALNCRSWASHRRQ